MTDKLGTALDATTKFEAPDSFKETAYIKTYEAYKAMYEKSLKDPDAFWSEVANDFVWFKKWDKINNFNFDLNKGPIKIEWFAGAKTNITVNCLDRQLVKRGNKTAIIWEGNEPTEMRKLTYFEMYAEVNKFANVLKKLGVKKGDRVSIYMPMIPELAIAMLACARIGAIHSIVFGGFSAESLHDRILDSTCKVVVTVDGSYRGKKEVPLKPVVDSALKMCEKSGHKVDAVVVYKRSGSPVNMEAGRDIYWDEIIGTVEDYCAPEIMDAEDPLFILYTSGSTGKPKGVLHTTAGYMVYTALTHKLIFDYHENDIYWCTADIGWVTGHSYIVYGPLANGATSIMFEGVPTYPDAGRFWEVCAKYKVNQFYTAPTAIRALMREGEEWINKHDLSSLKLLGSVGEPINPEAWNWYHKNVGKGRCPIVDTWWQTETGGILITPLPAAIAQKPGSATLPFFGVNPMILDTQDGKVLEGACEGALVIDRPWPGIMRTVYGDHERFEQTYFSMYKGYYLTGDAPDCGHRRTLWSFIMSLKRITLHLARSKEFPGGSAAHGYEFVAPLDGAGHLDAEGWKANKAACRVRRFWADEELDLGHLVHRGGANKGGSWAFTYDIAGDEDDEAGYRFGAHSFNPGDYVSIRDDDEVMHTFTVALVEPA